MIKLAELEQFETKIASLARIKGKLYQGNNGVGEEAEYKKIEMTFKNLRKPIPVRGPVCVFLNVDKNPRVSMIFLGKIKVKLGQRFGL